MVFTPSDPPCHKYYRAMYHSIMREEPSTPICINSLSDYEGWIYEYVKAASRSRQ